MELLSKWVNYCSQNNKLTLLVFENENFQANENNNWNVLFDTEKIHSINDEQLLKEELSILNKYPKCIIREMKSVDEYLCVYFKFKNRECLNLMKIEIDSI